MLFKTGDYEMCYVNINYSAKTSLILLATSVMMLISSGCISQEQYEAEARTHYASLSVVEANELEEFATACSPETKSSSILYQIVAFKANLQKSVLYVLRAKRWWTGGTAEYPNVTIKWELTELNALDVNSGNWLWSAWVPVGGKYVDSVICPDDKTMAVITWASEGSPLFGHNVLSIHNLEFEGQQLSKTIYSKGFAYGTNIRFSSDGKYLAVLGMNPDPNIFKSGGSLAIYIYRFPFSDYDNGAKKPLAIVPIRDSVNLLYESDPTTPSHLHVFHRDWSKTYYGIFDTETGGKIENIHLREDLRDTGDVGAVGNQILVIHGGNLTTFKPGNLTEVDTQCPLVRAGEIVSQTERFVVVGNFNYLGKERPYTLSIFDARNLNKPPAEVRILGLYNTLSEWFITSDEDPINYNSNGAGAYAHPLTAIVGDHLFILRVRSAGKKGTQCDLCTILRYDLRKIPSLWAQDEGTQ